MKTTEHSDQTLGEILQSERLLRKKTLDEVSKVIRVQVRFLKALEDNNFDVFESYTFAMGFLKVYAQFLGLDQKSLIKMLKDQEILSKQKIDLVFPQTFSEEAFPGKKVVWGSLIGIGFIGLIPLLLQEEPIPSVEVLTQNTPAIQESEIKNEKNTVLHAKLKALGKCWLEVKDSKKGVVFDKMLEAGEEYEISEDALGTFTIGNAGGIEIIMNGISSGPLGQDGDVVRNIPLSKEYIKENYLRNKIKP